MKKNKNICSIFLNILLLCISTIINLITYILKGTKSLFISYKDTSFVENTIKTSLNIKESSEEKINNLRKRVINKTKEFKDSANIIGGKLKIQEIKERIINTTNDIKKSANKKISINEQTMILLEDSVDLNKKELENLIDKIKEKIQDVKNNENENEDNI